MVQAPLHKLPLQVEAEQIGPDENHERARRSVSSSFLSARESVFQIRLEGPEKESELSLFFSELISFGHGRFPI